MVNEEHNNPVGFRFLPSPRELLCDYLLRVVMREPLPSNDVVFCDIYDENDSWNKRFQETGAPTLYFLTKLRLKDGKGERIVRLTKSGTWKETQAEKEILDPACPVPLGSKRSFKFIPNSGSKITGRWLMDEYALNPRAVGREFRNYVICNIRLEKEKEKEKETETETETEKEREREMEREMEKEKEKEKEKELNNIKAMDVDDPEDPNTLLTVEELERLMGW